ncbi:hypothetical protein [Pedobacter rhodius]|uniref:DUF4347 domain-containing protein n=1 Tax=Pedobacter rhodius TaxID=3004098 RepID=A0ABT4L034_9SPHI|nr:hypothetical protein [Pedobacter sp. SJ11]MCZ4224544.1 hypothetical protein [Pedobacter sp. SJ11]
MIIVDSAGKYSAKLIEFINSNVPENLNNIVAIYHGDKNLKNLDGQYSGKVLVLNADHVSLTGGSLKMAVLSII